MKHNIFSNLQNCNNVYIDEKFCSIIQEIILYEEYLHTIDDNLKYITFNILDPCRRDHFIKIYINEGYPINKDKPLYFDTMLPSTINSLFKVNICIFFS